MPAHGVAPPYLASLCPVATDMEYAEVRSTATAQRTILHSSRKRPAGPPVARGSRETPRSASTDDRRPVESASTLVDAFLAARKSRHVFGTACGNDLFAPPQREAFQHIPRVMVSTGPDAVRRTRPQAGSPEVEAGRRPDEGAEHRDELELIGIPDVSRCISYRLPDGEPLDRPPNLHQSPEMAKAAPELGLAGQRRGDPREDLPGVLHVSPRQGGATKSARPAQPDRCVGATVSFHVRVHRPRDLRGHLPSVHGDDVPGRSRPRGSGRKPQDRAPA